MGRKSASLSLTMVCDYNHSGTYNNLLIPFTGVRLVYLSPYSPDYNPIEEAFSKIKAFIRRNGAYFLARAHHSGIMFDMSIAMSIITPEDAKGYFRHAGYF